MPESTGRETPDGSTDSDDDGGKTDGRDRGGGQALDPTTPDAREVGAWEDCD